MAIGGRSHRVEIWLGVWLGIDVQVEVMQD